MATAEELLSSSTILLEGQESVLTIDNDLREISIPSDVNLLGVESDDDVRRLYFSMPSQYKELDLSDFDIRINFMNAAGECDIYFVADKEVLDGIITFSWLVGRTAFKQKGDVNFIVCLKKMSNGEVIQEFNTTLASLPVLEGLEASDIVIQQNPDVIEKILYSIGEIADKIKDAYTATNPPPYPVTSVNGKKGDVTVEAGTKIDFSDDPPSNLAQSASAGKSGKASRSDHVHKIPSAADIGSVYPNPDDTPNGGPSSINMYNKPLLYKGASSTFPTFLDQILGIDGKPLFTNGVVEGLIYPTTALELEAMTQEQQAELYGQGYRAIVATYNDTVTMHALAADGSLAWIGCNQDTTSLLDNGDFGIAQAGYGGMHGITTYAADRWVSSNLADVSFDGGNLVVVDDGSSTGAVYQKLMFDSPCKITITAGVAVQNAWKIAMFDAESGAEIASSAGSQAQKAILNAEITSDLTGKEISIFFYLFAGSPGGGSAQIFNAALYKGSYTAKTLPPYQPKGYGAELAECRRYFIRTTGNAIFVGAGSEDTSMVRCYIPTGGPMRMTVPSVSPASGLSVSVRVNTGGYNVTDATADVASTDSNGVLLRLTSANQIINRQYASAAVCINTPLSISADL